MNETNNKPINDEFKKNADVLISIYRNCEAYNEITKKVNEQNSINKILDETYTMLSDIYKPYIISIAKKFTFFEEQDDLIQYGHMGFLKAIKNFDFNKGTFSTFAYSEIRYAILDGIKKNTSIKTSQEFRQLISKIKKIVNDYKQNHLDEEPSDETIQDILVGEEIKRIKNHHLGDKEILETFENEEIANNDLSNEKELEKLIRNKIKIEKISLARYLQIDHDLIATKNDNSNENNQIDKIKDYNYDENNIYLNYDLSNMISKIYNGEILNDQERIVFLDKNGYNEEKRKYTNKEIASKMKLSESRIKKIYREANVKIKKYNDNYL